MTLFDGVAITSPRCSPQLLKPADVLLDAGQDRQAMWEIQAALPIIDEEKMVPEGYAAFSLLRESVRRHQIDRQALRQLHGYFPES